MKTNTFMPCLSNLLVLLIPTILVLILLLIYYKSFREDSCLHNASTGLSHHQVLGTINYVDDRKFPEKYVGLHEP